MIDKFSSSMQLKKINCCDEHYGPFSSRIRRGGRDFNGGEGRGDILIKNVEGRGDILIKNVEGRGGEGEGF